MRTVELSNDTRSMLRRNASSAVLFSILADTGVYHHATSPDAVMCPVCQIRPLYPDDFTSGVCATCDTYHIPEMTAEAAAARKNHKRLCSGTRAFLDAVEIHDVLPDMVTGLGSPDTMVNVIDFENAHDEP